MVVLIYSLDELTNREIESPSNIKGYRFLRSLIDLLGGGFLLFRPTDDDSYLKTVHLQQLKGMQSFKQGIWKGNLFRENGI